MKKTILSILLCVPFASGFAAESNSNAMPPEVQYIDAVRAISPDMGTLLTDISSVRKQNCNETLSIQSMQDTLANDDFVFETLRKNAADPSYLVSDVYRTGLNKAYRQCS